MMKMKLEINVIPLALLISILLNNSHLIQCQRYGTKGGRQPPAQQPVQRPMEGYGPSSVQQQQEEGPSYNQVEEGAADAEPPVYGGVVGAQPGVDFPGFLSLNELPESDFKCDSAPHSWGYYADSASQCQAFHICFDGRQTTMLCPVGTVFDQELLTCNYWNQVDCSQAPNFYSVNAELGVASGEPASGGGSQAPARGSGGAGRGGAAPPPPSQAGRGGGYGQGPAAAPRTPSRAGPASFQPQQSQDEDEGDYGQAPAPAPAPAPRPSYQPQAPAPRPAARAPAPAPRPSFNPQVTQQNDEDSYGPPPAPAYQPPAQQPPVKRPVRPRATQQTKQPPSQPSSYRPPAAPSQMRQQQPPQQQQSYGGGSSKGGNQRQSPVTSQLNAADDDYNWSGSHNYYDTEPFHMLSYYRY